MKQNTPAERQFITEAQKEADRIDEIRADAIVWSIIGFLIICLLITL